MNSVGSAQGMGAGEAAGVLFNRRGSTLSSVEHILNDGVVYKPLRDRVPEIACALAWRADNTLPALASVLRIGDRVLPTPTPQGIS
jgi:hypothetical protein